MSFHLLEQEQEVAVETMMLRLGVFDFCALDENQGSIQRIEETREMARLAEHLGYVRYWMPEHHGGERTAQSNPTLMASIVAAATRRIRVGSAGVLLRYRSTYMAAEDYRLLSSAFPDRIELGIAAGSMPEGIAASILEGRAPPTRGMYEGKVEDLVRELRGRLPGDHRFNAGRPCPLDAKPPQIWLLGSGPGTAPLAAMLHTSFAFGLFLAGAARERGPDIMSSYRAQLPSSAGSPASNLTVAVALGESQSAAETIAHRHEMVNAFIKPNIVGDPSQCAAQLRDLAATYGVEDVSVLPVGDDSSIRLNCIEALSKELR